MLNRVSHRDLAQPQRRPRYHQNQERPANTHNPQNLQAHERPTSTPQADQAQIQGKRHNQEIEAKVEGGSYLLKYNFYQDAFRE